MTVIYMSGINICHVFIFLYTYAGDIAVKAYKTNKRKNFDRF